MTFHLPFSAIEWSFWKAFFPLSLLSTSGSSDPRRMTWPEPAARWILTVKLVPENTPWRLGVCPCRLAPCVTWTLHKHEGRRRRTRAAVAGSLQLQLTERLAALHSSVISPFLFFDFHSFCWLSLFFPLSLHSCQRLCVCVSCGLACACITPSDLIENETNLPLWGLK